MKTKIRIFAAALLGAVTLSGTALAAQSYSFEFGTLLSGNYQPANSFASLSVESTDDITFNFELQTNDLNSIFNSGAFIGKLIFNSPTDDSPLSLSAVAGGGVNEVTLGNGPNVGSIEFDFSSVFGQGAGDRLTANEFVAWSVTFADAQTPLFGNPAAAIHVQGLSRSTDPAGSAWYTPTSPVPEPETYAMLLAGLGLVSAVARRRKQTSSRITTV